MLTVALVVVIDHWCLCPRDRRHSSYNFYSHSSTACSYLTLDSLTTLTTTLVLGMLAGLDRLGLILVYLLAFSF